jgi:hypothetical protein
LLLLLMRALTGNGLRQAMKRAKMRHAPMITPCLVSWIPGLLAWTKHPTAVYAVDTLVLLGCYRAPL